MITKNENNNSPNTAQKKPIQKSFGYALQGISYFFRNERNGRLQLLIAGCVFLAGIVLSITMTEWLLILLFTALVISLEMFNSALEKFCDHINPDWHPQIKVIKDMAAGAVLWASILSVLAGLCIFIPKIIQIL